MVRMASRLSRWGARSLSLESRRSPIALLLSEHFGLDKVGTVECKYQKLYDLTFELKRLVESYRRTDVPSEHIAVFPLDPLESMIISSDLVEFATEGAELCIAQPADYNQCL